MSIYLSTQVKRLYFFKDCCCCPVVKLCPALWDPVDSSMPGSSVLHSLLEFAQIHVQWISDAIRPSHSLLPLSPLYLKRYKPPKLTQKEQVLCRIQDARDWCTGMTQRDDMGREVGGGIRMRNMCTPVVDSCWCMAKPIQYCKVINLQLK